MLTPVDDLAENASKNTKIKKLSFSPDEIVQLSRVLYLQEKYVRDVESGEQ